MNGQLFAPAVPQPNQRNAYRLMLNAMLAAGLRSNWWLNPTGMKNEDLAWVNEPALRMGPLFTEFAPNDHDVAVLWSFTEICMREKSITAREAKKKTGEQIKLMIASLPDVPGARDKLIDVNAYNVGGNYKEQVLSAHQALARAGYPAHIIHERIITPRLLERYKTLVIVGQTAALPEDVKESIDGWTQKGGTVIVDETTKVKLDRAVVTKADFRDPAFRWSAYFGAADKAKHPFKNNREASRYLTNWFMDEQVRKSVGPLKESMKKTRSQPAIETDSIHLAAERHTAGDSALYMVINAHDKLPDIPADKRYWLYNYAPLEATFTLKGIKPGSRVVCIEGQDWKRVREVKDYDKPLKASFEPGEMKLYLVTSGKGRMTGMSVAGAPNLQIIATSKTDAAMGPQPLTVSIRSADGTELYRAHRANPAGKSWSESFPLGANRADGPLLVTLESLGESWSMKVAPKPDKPSLSISRDVVRVFDEKPMRAFLKARPALVIAVGESHKEAAEKLAAELTRAGFDAKVKPERDVLRKVAYPRVWNPFAMVYSPTGKENKPSGYSVKTEITLTHDKDGALVALTAGGKDVSADWRLPNSLVAIADGYVDYGGDRELCFEKGVKLYFDERRQMTAINAAVKEEKTTSAFRQKWARPWGRLTTHVGGYQLPPELPEAYTTDSHLILLGDSKTSKAVTALQASEVLPQAVDARYPGPGKALVQFAWSPFAVEKNVIFVGAGDKEGLQAGVARLLKLAK